MTQEHRKHIPKHVALVGNGPSRQDFISDVNGNKGDVPWDAVWVLNAGGIVFRHDLAFCLDDLRYLEKKTPHLAAFMQHTSVPFITSTAYPEYSAALAYPYDEILDLITVPNIFCNSGPMALAYGFWLGVKKFSLFGFDYYYPRMDCSEFGGQAMAFLVGMAGRFGASVELTPHTTLLGNHHMKWRNTKNGLEGNWPYYGKPENIEFYNSLVTLPPEEK